MYAKRSNYTTAENTIGRDYYFQVCDQTLFLQKYNYGEHEKEYGHLVVGIHCVRGIIHVRNCQSLVFSYADSAFPVYFFRESAGYYLAVVCAGCST